MNIHVDSLAQANCRRTYYRALDTSNLAESSVSVTSLGDIDQLGSRFVHITEEVEHQHAQKNLLRDPVQHPGYKLSPGCSGRPAGCGSGGLTFVLVVIAVMSLFSV